MIAPQTFNNYPEFGVAAVKCCPDAAKYANGYIQGDVLPAEHLNWFLSGATVGVSALQLGMDSLEKEMQTLLCCAGITPSGSCNSQIYDAVMYQIQASANTKAPNMHASSATTYGVGNADCYGHLKISDTYSSVLSACSGVAASQKAMACVYDVANGKPNLGNTAGCALAYVGSSGTSGNAARADHVHPLPSCVQDKYTSTVRPIGIGFGGSGLTCAQIGNLAAYSANYDSNCVVIKDAPKGAVQCWLGLGTAAYCAAGCFRASTWTPSVVDCSKRLTACDNTAVGLFAEGGNEINMKFGTCTNVMGWLNYRGGVSAIKVGQGTCNGSMGDVYARCFYGNVCGVATSAGQSCTSGNAVARKNEGTCFWSVIATNAKQCDIFKVLSWINPTAGTILGQVGGSFAQCLFSSGDSSYTVFDSLGQNYVIWNTCTATLGLRIGGIN